MADVFGFQQRMKKLAEKFRDNHEHDKEIKNILRSALKQSNFLDYLCREARRFSEMRGDPTMTQKAKEGLFKREFVIEEWEAQPNKRTKNKQCRIVELGETKLLIDQNEVERENNKAEN